MMRSFKRLFHKGSELMHPMKYQGFRFSSSTSTKLSLGSIGHSIPKFKSIFWATSLLSLIGCSTLVSANESTPELKSEEPLPGANKASCRYSSRCPCEEIKKANPTTKDHPCTIAHEFVPGCHELKIFSGTIHPNLAADVAHHLGVDVAQAKISTFADGEISIKILDNVRGTDVYLIQPTSRPACDTVMELLLMVSCLRRSSAKRVTAVIPYFSFRRNLQVTNNNNDNTSFIFSSASEISKMLEVMGVDSVIVVDMARDSRLGFVDGSFFSNVIPVENYNTTSLCVNHFSDIVSRDKELMIIVPSPREHGKASEILELFKKTIPNLKVRMAPIIYDPKDKLNLEIHCDLTGCDVMIVDYAIQTGNVLKNLANSAKSKGADNIYAFATHFLGDEKTKKLVEDSPISKILVTDTLPLPPSINSETSKFEVESIAVPIANIIKVKHFVTKE